MINYRAYNVSLDVEQLGHISGGDEAFERELLELYLEDALLRIEQLQAEVTQHDFSAIEETAHYIKGASANVGLTDLQRCSADLEMAARQQQANGLASLINEMQQGLGNLQNALAHGG